MLEAAGKEGQAVLHDIDVFISGINDYLAANSPSTAPFTRNDIYALNALKGQFLGEGGGDEARRSQFLGGLQQQFGAKTGNEHLQRPAPVQEPRAADIDRRPLSLRLDPEASPRAA